MLTVRELIQYLSENADMDDVIGVSDGVSGLVSGVVEVQMEDYTPDVSIVSLNLGDRGSAIPLKDDEGVYTYDEEEDTAGVDAGQPG